MLIRHSRLYVGHCWAVFSFAVSTAVAGSFSTCLLDPDNDGTESAASYDSCNDIFSMLLICKTVMFAYMQIRSISEWEGGRNGLI